MNQSNFHVSLQLDAQGQFILPAVLQQALNLQVSDTLLAYLENNRIILEKNKILSRN